MIMNCLELNTVRIVDILLILSALGMLMNMDNHLIHIWDKLVLSYI